MNLFILDCTLRDGGYINEWNFGKQCIKHTAALLHSSNIELIELGFLDDTKTDNSENFTVFHDIKTAEKMIEISDDNFLLMIMHGKYHVEKLPQYNGGKIKGIRYCFKKQYADEALQICSQIQQKGYDVYLQPASLTDYSDSEIIELVQKANKLNICAFYIVDTYGVMRKNEVIRFFYIIDNNLKKGVPIGFHSHNNLQLSFSNAQALIEINRNRELYIDSSVFGMGRGAGNLCTELLTQYINENIENKYDLIPILEIMDEYIMPIYSTKPWGYSAPYYIAAINNCHPNYATYLMNKQTLCIRDINSIIKSIPDEKKHLYDVELISQLYLKYQQHSIDDRKILHKLSEICAEKEILIIAPGKSIATYKNEISQYIFENSPIIFAVNHIPEIYPYDMVFISNLKRFKGIDDAFFRLGDKLICTSNISDRTENAVNYSAYLNDDEIISDNAGLMLINVLKKAGVKKLTLAGYDGFDPFKADNYFDGKLNLNIQYKKREDMNRAIISYFEKLRRSIDVKFLTPTIYDTGENA